LKNETPQTDQELYRDSIVSELTTFASNPLYDTPDFAGLYPHFTARDVAVAFPSTVPNSYYFGLFEVDMNQLKKVAAELGFAVGRLNYEDSRVEPAYVFTKI